MYNIVYVYTIFSKQISWADLLFHPTGRPPHNHLFKKMALEDALKTCPAPCLPPSRSRPAPPLTSMFTPCAPPYAHAHAQPPPLPLRSRPAPPLTFMLTLTPSPPHTHSCTARPAPCPLPSLHSRSCPCPARPPTPHLIFTLSPPPHAHAPPPAPLLITTHHATRMLQPPPSRPARPPHAQPPAPPPHVRTLFTLMHVRALFTLCLYLLSPLPPL